MTYWIVGQVGTREVAAASVIVNLTLVAILPGLALGLSASTLVGQALGRGQPGDAYQWGWDVARVGMVALGAIGLPGVIWPELLLMGFIHDPATMEVATLPMRLVALFMAVDGLGLVMMHALLGAGDARRVMFVSVVAQWGVFLPLAYLMGPGLGFGLAGIWALQVGYRGGQALVVTRFWEKRDWVALRV